MGLCVWVWVCGWVRACVFVSEWCPRLSPAHVTDPTSSSKASSVLLACARVWVALCVSSADALKTMGVNYDFKVYNGLEHGALPQEINDVSACACASVCTGGV